MKNNLLSYVLITPAKNEEAHIERVIRAVLAQTVLPACWIIVSDGSTDRTDIIVSDFVRRYAFIKSIRMKSGAHFSFASKANAFRIGYEMLEQAQYEFVGNLDADVAFNPDYFERLMKRFEQMSMLGVAGGLIHELSGGIFYPLSYSPDSVAGAVQLFRSECYVQIGGYMSVETGGIDAIAETMARKNQWLVRTFPDLPVYHYRKIGLNGQSLVKSGFRKGINDHLIGTHGLFLIAKCFRRISERPFFLSSLLRLLGYLYSSVMNRNQRPVGDDLVRFLQAEQLQKLRNIFLRFKTYLLGARKDLPPVSKE